MSVHLCARDEGIERLGRKEGVFWKAAAAIEGRKGRAGTNCDVEMRDGRTRRRRNVRGMAGGAKWWSGFAVPKV